MSTPTLVHKIWSSIHRIRRKAATNPASKRRKKKSSMTPPPAPSTTTSTLNPPHHPNPTKTNSSSFLPTSTPKPCSPTPLKTSSEEHTSELQSLMRISYAVSCLKKTNHNHL